MRWLAAALLVCAAVPAAAQRPGAIVFARFGGVYQQPADLTQPAVQIAELPDDAAEVRWIESIRDGRLVVIDFTSYANWLYAPDPTKPAELRSGACTGRAHPNPYGGCLVCPTREGTMMIAAGRDDQALLPGKLEETAFVGDSGFDLGARTEEGIIGFDRREPATIHLLAQPGPRSHLVFSPDGKKGVAVFGEGDAMRIRSFLLDGQGVSRQLGGPGFPTLWSWDSQWVLFQEGDIKDAGKGEEGGEESLLEAPDRWILGAPPTGAKRSTNKRPRTRPGRKSDPAASNPPLIRACVARGTGGEVKCWDNYVGLAFSPDSTLVLLKRDKALYVGKIAGVRPDPPQKIIDDVEGAATWVPNLIAAPLPPAQPPGVDSTP